MIRHIVLWKQLEGHEQEKEQFLSGLRGLVGVIPGLHSVETHRADIPGQFDACLIADFDDAQALASYREDPRHIAVASIGRAIAVSRASIDFEI